MRAAVLLLLAACSAPTVAKPAAGPARPAGCIAVAAGADLQATVDGAKDGAILCLAPGAYRGPLLLARPLTLWGPAEAVIRSSGEGTTVRIDGAARLAGVTIDGSGGRYDLLDAAVHVTGDGGVVDGIHVVNAMYGILSEKARGVTLSRNRVVGDARQTFGLRGDPIRLWETTDSLVIDNDVQDGRDVVVWYSSRNRVEGNRVRGGRYGTHFMYSHGNHVARNRYEGDVVGIFVMYSRDLVIEDNVASNAMAASGIGIGLKDSGNVQLYRNTLVHDRIGIYIDNSPTQQSDHNWAVGNVIRLCDTGVVFHGGAERNGLLGNDLIDNQLQVATEGGGDARGAVWSGNHFDDYAGYDLDGDGTGDIPYELRSLAGELTGRYPDLAFFRGTPSLALADAAGKLVPIFRPTTMLVDARPRMGASHAR